MIVKNYLIDDSGENDIIAFIEINDIGIRGGYNTNEYNTLLIRPNVFNNYVKQYKGQKVNLEHTNEIIGVVADVFQNLNGFIVNGKGVEADGQYYVKLTLDNKKITKDKLLDKELGISTEYLIEEYKQNVDNELYDGNNYDAEVIKLKPQGLAITATPRSTESKGFITNSMEEIKKEAENQEDGKLSSMMQEMLDILKKHIVKEETDEGEEAENSDDSDADDKKKEDKEPENSDGMMKDMYNRIKNMEEQIANLCKKNSETSEEKKEDKEPENSVKNNSLKSKIQNSFPKGEKIVQKEEINFNWNF